MSNEKILLVDWEEIHLEMMETILEDNGYDVDTSTTYDDDQASQYDRVIAEIGDEGFDPRKNNPENVDIFYTTQDPDEEAYSLDTREVTEQRPLPRDGKPLHLTKKNNPSELVDLVNHLEY